MRQKAWSRVARVRLVSKSMPWAQSADDEAREQRRTHRALLLENCEQLERFDKWLLADIETCPTRDQGSSQLARLHARKKKVSPDLDSKKGGG